MFRQLIKFPNHLGQTKLGVAQTPYSLQKLIRSDITQHMVSVTRDLYVNLFNLFQKNQTISGPRINLGGDHSMSLATVADSLERHDNLKVVWMDAHCDLNTYNSSPSKNMHGMPMATLLGQGDTTLTSILHPIAKVKPENAFFIGNHHYAISSALKELKSIEKNFMK